jgi:hypothetical protein
MLLNQGWAVYRSRDDVCARITAATHIAKDLRSALAKLKSEAEAGRGLVPGALNLRDPRVLEASLNNNLTRTLKEGFDKYGLTTFPALFLSRDICGCSISTPPPL